MGLLPADPDYEGEALRFPAETCALVHKAGDGTVTIPWPADAPEPKLGKIYWLQSQEAADRAKERLAYSPPTHADVMASMHEHFYGAKPKVKKKRRPTTGRPRAGDSRIVVVDRTILDIGWEATVEIYEDPDPIRHTGIRAKVKGGPRTLFLGDDLEPASEPTETEPEQIVTKPSRTRRLEEEEAMKIAHRASVDHSEAIRSEQKLLNQRRKGKRSPLAEAAVERAKRRAALDSADLAA